MWNYAAENHRNKPVKVSEKRFFQKACVRYVCTCNVLCADIRRFMSANVPRSLFVWIMVQ